LINQYYPVPILLDFGEQMGTSIFTAARRRSHRMHMNTFTTVCAHSRCEKMPLAKIALKTEPNIEALNPKNHAHIHATN
jgi:hypothetical protein